MKLWSDGKTEEEIHYQANKDSDNVIFNLLEDIKCLKEDKEELSNIVNSKEKQTIMYLSDDIKRALIESTNLAMKNTVKARVPECGDFGSIAQNLGFICNELATK